MGGPTELLAVLPARGSLQADVDFDQAVGLDDWPDMEPTAGAADDTWD